MEVEDKDDQESLDSQHMQAPACLNWTAEDVGEWIVSLGFPQYKMCFISNLVTGRKLIWINSSTLPRLGITDWSHIQHITSELRELLHVEKPYWNRSITLPYRCDMGVFLEQKSQTGQYGDQLKFESFKNANKF